MAFKFTAAFHPTLRAPRGLAAAREFFPRVFGRETRGPSAGAPRPGAPPDYCALVMIQEVLFDTVDPMIMPSRVNPAPEADNPPHLTDIAFYVEDHADLVRACLEKGVTLLDVQGQPMRPGERSEVRLAGRQSQIAFTDFRSWGLAYQLQAAPEPSPAQAGGLDPRQQADWRLSPASPSDPLMLERCAWHTLLTDNPERLRFLFTQVFGGMPIHETVNEAQGTESLFVALGDGVYELARPMRPGFARDDLAMRLRGCEDCYHSLTFKTADLDKARAHLAAQGVGLRIDTPDWIVTDPAQTLGVPWGFISTLVPGDQRG